MLKKSFLHAILICLSVVVLTSCSHKQKFDRVKWAYGDGLTYSYRDDLVDDLIKNHKLKGLTYRQAIDSLGRAQGVDTLQISYLITDDTYKHGRKGPAHKKYLILHFSKDSVVSRAELYDHTDKK